jgi:hypothetical protein
MRAKDGTSRKFVLLDRAIIACASVLQVCRTRVARFATPPRGESTTPQQSSPAETTLQQLTRVRLPNGTVQIRGTVLAEFAVGDRQTTVYVGFCPPFETLPQAQANIVEDIEADIKLTQVLHNGMQFDVRLSEAAEESIALPIDFLASEGDH